MEDVQKILSGDRTALARAITLIESTRPDHQEQAQKLLQQLLPRTGRSIRVGITGVPGVGKSTLIEALGLHVISKGHKVAVLAVDPSSSKTGGSILGDKTRMTRLSQETNAYIRPSPAGGTLGGVARRSREALLLAEAAGYDVVLVETVGVGQSEIDVASMVDMFVLLLLPGSGDELQGIKRGIVELADLLVVNKADGDLLAQAKRVKADYTAALRMLSPPLTSPLQAGGKEKMVWQPRVEMTSATTGGGINTLWECVEEFSKAMHASGGFDVRRAEQAKTWMWKEVRETLFERFCTDPAVIRLIPESENRAEARELTASQAARQLLEAYYKKN